MGNIKKSLIAFGVLALTSLVSISANASLLIEPHLGYNLSGTGTASNYAFKYTSPEYGLKLGTQYLGLMAGLDYTASTYTWTRTPGSDDKFNRGELGLFVGYNLPILVRFWGAYYFSNTATDQDSSGNTASGTEYKGNTKELGIGFTPIPFLSVNVIYRNVNFTTKPAGISIADLSISEFVLGVSCPITLL